MVSNRFQDKNKQITDFQKEVFVVCPKCAKRALARANYEENKARLFCENCGYNKEIETEVTVFGHLANYQLAAHSYFNVDLWLKAQFKDDVFFAYNYEHLEYLEQYIGAKLREHKDRSHFTVLEKLPKFYHDSKNRESLLKLIQKLKSKKL